MARVLAFIDRPPEDDEWKGALAWQIILSLAEAHHEVMVATPLDLDRIQITHPRLQVTQPVRSWRADQLPKLVSLLLAYRPQVIHAFAPRPSRQWTALSLWPYMNAFCLTLPIRRVSTLFDGADWAEGHSALAWHKDAHHVTVFSERHREVIPSEMRPKTEVLPLDLVDFGIEPATSRLIVVPAPVSEWTDADGGLKHLAEYLISHPEQRVRIIGGWGDWPASKRKNAWKNLQTVAGRIELTEPFDLPRFARELALSERLWLQPISPDAWKFLLGRQLAQKSGKPVYLSTPVESSAVVGSTANSLSRLYTGAELV